MDCFFRSNIKIMETILKETETRPLSDLPHELLSTVADRLGIIELLSFHDTCKDWQSSSSTAPAWIESSPDTKPWFLHHPEGNPQCILLNLFEKNNYNINIPELEESTCLASNQGWLLLFNIGSILFFCLFSRTRIDLPSLLHWKLSDHVGMISSPPASKDCIVCVINRVDELKVALNLLKRRDKKWDTGDHECPLCSLNTVKGGTFQEVYFYFLDKDNKLLTYSLKMKKWEIQRIVESRSSSSASDCLPFLYKKNYFQGNWYLNNLSKYWGKNFSISTCGTLVE